ncbi:MAG TPA: hypothetical protein VM287_08325 [Egibacteraceae bacterium]|nr:hypothetical protein [Egibacteraceae bacterium]
MASGTPAASVEHLDVHFDFTCRFANWVHLWLGQLTVDADWLPFSLLEAKREGDGPPVWQQAEHADNISLLLLAGHELVREHRGDIAAYRRSVFAAWHGKRERLDRASVLGYAERSGVEAAAEDLHAAVALVGDRHGKGVERGVFGSPTIVFPSGQGSFVRFTDLPSVDQAPAILAALRTLAERAPELVHLERLRDAVVPAR